MKHTATLISRHNPAPQPRRAVPLARYCGLVGPLAPASLFSPLTSLRQGVHRQAGPATGLFRGPQPKPQLPGGRSAAMVSTLVAMTIASAQAVEFHRIDAPGQTLDGQALSGDGLVVAGTQGGSFTALPFRWSRTGGYQVLPAPSSATHGWVTRMNYDGSAFIGSFLGGGSGYRWSASGGYTDLINAPDRNASAPRGISGDGTVVVGDAGTTASQLYHTFRFDAGGYTVYKDQGLGTDVRYYAFTDVSGNGRYALGWGQIPPGYGDKQVFRHDFDTGQRVVLGASDYQWVGTAISADASIVIGHNGGTSPFRWDLASGTVSFLGSLDPTRPATVRDLNGDGSWVVGLSSVEGGSSAFVWDAAGGMRSLSAFIQEKGGDPTGWTFSDAVGISDDGDAILARGTQAGFDSGPILITGLAQPLIPAMQIALSSDGLTFEISFGTVTGQEYWLEGSTSLAAGDWIGKSPPTAGTGTTQTIPVSRSSLPQDRYFLRVATRFAP